MGLLDAAGSSVTWALWLAKGLVVVDRAPLH